MKLKRVLPFKNLLKHFYQASPNERRSLNKFSVKPVNMKLPWNQNQELKDKISELEEKLEETREDKESVEKQLEAEKERRSNLSSQKQEAEEKINRLKDKLENQETQKEDKKTKENNSWRKLNFKEAEKTLKKIHSIKSPDKDMITVYHSRDFNNLPDVKGLKNTLNSKDYKRISSEENVIAFTDGETFNFILKTRPFFEPDWSLKDEFDVEELLEFMDRDKHWALVTTGETKIFEEQNGVVSEVERVKTRVDDKQKKGGFSQGRFENKRDEQIQEQVKKTRETLKQFNDVKLIGNKKLCMNLDGKYLGGFDSSKNMSAEALYCFKIKNCN